MPSEQTSGTTRLSIESKRVRMLTYLSAVMIVFSGGGYAVFVGRHWSWAPFVLGLVAAAVGLVSYVALWRILLKALPQTPERAVQARERRRWQSAVTVPQYVSYGLASGLAAGSMPAYWPDIVLVALMVGVGFLLPLAFLPLAKRKAQGQRGL